MKINNKLLKNIFEGISKFDSLNSSHMPLFNYSLLEIDNENLKLNRKGVDFFASVEVKNENTHFDNVGSFVLNTKSIHDLTKKIKENVDLEMKTDKENIVTIVSDSGKYDLNTGTSVKAYKEIIKENEEKTLLFDIPLKSLVRILHIFGSVYTNKQDSSVTNLLSFKIDRNLKELTILALDGKRIAKLNIKTNVYETANIKLLGRLFTNTINFLKEVNQNFMETVSVYKANNEIIFKTNNSNVFINEPNKEFPSELSRHFNQDGEISVLTINSKELKDSIERVDSFVSNSARKISLSYSNNVEIKSEESSSGHFGKENLKAKKFIGKKSKINFTADLVKQSLNSFDGTNIDMKFIDAGKPFILENKEERLSFVVLPIA